MRRLGMSVLLILGRERTDTESESAQRYQASLLKLASAASAKETACVFVMGRDDSSLLDAREAGCRALSVDYEAKRVKSRALFVAPRPAISGLARLCAGAPSLHLPSRERSGRQVSSL